MAELAVTSIARLLLQHVDSLAKDEFKLWFNSNDELDKLKSTITCIKDVLHDAGQKEATNEDIGKWLSKLKDVMYKGDDLFDTISSRALKKKVIYGNRFKKEIMIFFSKSNQAVFAVKTAHKVKELRGQLDAIVKDIGMIGLMKSAIGDDHGQGPIAMRERAQHSFIMEEQVIGREKEKRELLTLLMENAKVEDRISIIAVVGIGGQGKTAIAKMLYNEKEVDEFFQVRLWACINNFSNVKEVLEEITGTKSHSLDELQYKLRAKISGKKFLLVIDDVWDDIREHWLELRNLLYVGESGSKVLITTRSQMVAQNLITISPYYALRDLSDEDAWELFKKMAFQNGEEADPTKEELGRLIFRKCSKVPLAIKTIGSFLYGKSEEKWSKFIDENLMSAMDDDENIVKQALQISYDDLSSSLKQCYAYCSLFPKDYEFDKTTLIHLWMSQGLLEVSKKNPSLEEIAEDHFWYLVHRGFLQNVEVSEFDKTTSCKMHDLFHDLAVEIAGNECQSMLKVADILGKKIPRHLLIKNIDKPLLKCKGLRSLMSPNTGFVERELLDGVLLHLTSLRTLSLRQLETERIPSSISMLAHLRYLDLMDSEKLTELSNSVCQLQNLMILRLEGCRNLIKLPGDLCKLISLRCLAISRCDKLECIPLGLEKLTSLVTLDRLIVHKDNGGLRCLKNLDNLTNALCIELPSGGWKDCVDDAEQCTLSKKTKLRNLSLSWSTTTEESQSFEVDIVLCWLQPSDNINHLEFKGFPGVKFPNWLSSLRSLVDLSLEECKRCVELPPLKFLICLKRLFLWSITLLEYVENDTCYESGPLFMSLEVLIIGEMPQLKGWCRPKGEETCQARHDFWFPQVSTLSVHDCPQLTSLPSCPFVNYLNTSGLSGNLVTQMVRLPKLMEREAYHSSMASTSTNLDTQSCSKLTVLCLENIHDLAFVPDDFKNMLFVRQFHIHFCPGIILESLFSLLQNLPSLVALSLVGCDTTRYLDDGFETMGIESTQWSVFTRLKYLNLDLGKDALGGQLFKKVDQLTRLERLEIKMHEMPSGEDIQCTAPSNLEHLSISGMEKVVVLCTFIRQLKNLRHLEFSLYKDDEHELNKLPWKDLKRVRRLEFHSCNSIKSLPENCQHLSSLEDLEILHCKEIISLPRWVSRLRSLEIRNCSKLKEACKKPFGSCWSLIQDIQFFSIHN